MMSTPAPQTALQEWKHSWPLVLASMLGTGLCVVHLYSLGIFMKPLADAFGMSRTEISSGLLLVSAASVVGSPIIGYLIDRLGPRRIGIPGAVFYCVAVALLATNNGSLWVWWGLWFLVGLGALLIKPTVWTAAVGTYFSASRGLAFAVTLTGTGVCSAITPIIADQLVATLGWRMAYVVLSALWGAVVIPLCYFLFFSSNERANRNTGAKAAPVTLPGMTLREALRSTRFYRLGGSIFLITLSITGLTIHFVPIIIAGGLSSTAAAGLAGIIGISSIVGRLSTGYLFDRIDGRFVGVGAAMLPIIAASLLLGFDGSPVHGGLIACAVGLALGSETDVAAYLAGRHFGLRYYGTVFGTYVGVIGLATGGGPMLAAGAYDTFGAYTPYAMLIIPMCLAGAGLVASLGPYPEFGEPAPDEAGRANIPGEK